jgi:hypothetical protein
MKEKMKTKIKQKPKGKKRGRKPIISADDIRKLEAAFHNDYDISEALIYSGVKRTTYYAELKRNEQFANKMKEAQSKVSMKCKSVIVEAILNGDPLNARWWLERRRRKDYATRSELTGEDGEKIEGIIIFKPEKYPNEQRVASASRASDRSTKTK